jgi:hypothetical protein
MKISQIMYFAFLVIIIIIMLMVNSTYKQKRLQYIRKNTDDKTFAWYLVYKQAISILILLVILVYVVKNKF